MYVWEHLFLKKVMPGHTLKVYQRNFVEQLWTLDINSAKHLRNLRWLLFQTRLFICLLKFFGYKSLVMLEFRALILHNVLIVTSFLKKLSSLPVLMSTIIFFYDFQSKGNRCKMVGSKFCIRLASLTISGIQITSNYIYQSKL